jgi:hypothetical protein
MHCKHCGNQIENDSNFCSFCGGKTVPIGETFQTQQPLTQVQSENIVTQSEKPAYQSSRHDNGYFVAGILFFGLQVFWTLFTKFVDNWYSDFKYVVIGVNILFSALPILLSIYTKKKEHKIVLLIMGLLLIGWSIYAYFIQNI